MIDKVFLPLRSSLHCLRAALMLCALLASSAFAQPPVQAPVPKVPPLTDAPATIGITAEDIAKHMILVPGQHFKVAKYKVTRAQFEEFVKATNYAGKKCRVWDGAILNEHPEGAYNNLGFTQSLDDPAVCISYEDAEAYIKWLNETAKPFRPYRLPKDTEWVLAARGGTTNAFPWGSDVLDKAKCNCVEKVCFDGFPFTSPQGKFGENKIGLVDIAGNAWEWTTACYFGDCRRRLIRGGSWNSSAQDQMRVDFHWGNSAEMRSANIGLRLFQDE